MRKKQFVLMLVLFFVLAIIVFIFIKKEPQIIKIGAIFPLTGDAASWGEMGKEGIDLALDKINKNGGIKGKKISVIYEDSRAEPAQGVTAIQKLINVDMVSAVIGDIVSATTLAMAPVAEKNQVVLLSPTASAPKITEAGKYIFRIWPSDLAEGKSIADFAFKTLNLRKISILYIQNDYGIGLQQIFSKVFTDQGGEIKSSLSYKSDETDFRSYISKLKTEKPDAVYLVSYYRDASIFFRQAKESGLLTQFLGTTALEEPKLIELAGNAAENIIYPMSTGFDANSQDPIVQEFISDFKAKYNKEPGFVSAQCYDAVKILLFALEKVGDGHVDIQGFLANLKGYRGVTGETTFDENGDAIKPTIIKQILNGKFVPFEKQ